MIFKASGKTPMENEVLIILHSGKTIISGINVSNFVGILDGPLDFYCQDFL